MMIDSLSLSLIALAYVLGSIPFGLILTRLAGAGDIRAIGSGNIGATNVLRTGRKGLAALTLFLDGLKGFAATAAAYKVLDYTDNNIGLTGWIALAAVVGHVYSVWLRFKGGKGVATILGSAFGLHPLLGVAGCGTWLLVAFTLRISSLAAIIAVSALPVYCLLVNPAFTLPVTLASLLVLYRHKDNITRLRQGTEPKIGQKKA